jgi:hypothetical protein
MRVRPSVCGLVLLATLAACRKEKPDDQAPSVSFLMPGEGAELTIPDTLAIQVSVSDDREVRNLTVQLLSPSGVPVVNVASTSVNAASATINAALVLLSEQLASGAYTLQARASDGTNDGFAFRTIQVQAAPWRLRAVYITSPWGLPGTATLSRIDSVGQVDTWSLGSELGGAAMDPATQRLFTSGITQAPLQAYPVGPGATAWSVANLHSGSGSTPYFLGLRVDPVDGRLYTGTEDGRIRGWTTSGSSTLVAQVPAGRRSEATAVVGDKLVSEQVEVAGGGRSLATHSYTAGTLLQQFTLNVDVLVMHQRTSSHALVFGNRNGDGVVQDRQVELGGNFEVRIFPGAPLHAVAQVNATTYVLAHGDRVSRWTYTTDDLSTLITGVDVDALAYDPASGVLFMGIGNTVEARDPLTGALVYSRSLPHPVGSILPLRNR